MRGFEARWHELSRRELRTVLLGAGVLLLALVAGRLVGWCLAEPELDVRTARETVAAPPRLDLNTASTQELMLLHGIGRHTADAIVRYRSEHGPFRSLEDLKRVHGIGDTMLERRRPDLMCRPPAE